MPLCPKTNEMIGMNLWCRSCDTTHKKQRTVAKQRRRDYVLAIIGMNLVYVFILWLEANDY